MQRIDESEGLFRYGDWLFDDWRAVFGVAPSESKGLLVIFAALPWMMTPGGGLNGAFLAVDYRGRGRLLPIGPDLKIALHGPRDSLEHRPMLPINEQLGQAAEIARHSPRALRALRRAMSSNGNFDPDAVERLDRAASRSRSDMRPALGAAHLYLTALGGAGGGS